MRNFRSLADLSPPPPELAPPPAMADFKVLEVFHSFTDKPIEGWHLVAAFGRGPGMAAPSEAERHILMQAACGLRDRYGEQLQSTGEGYAHAAARFPGRTIFVYLTPLWWPAPNVEARH